MEDGARPEVGAALAGVRHAEGVRHLGAGGADPPGGAEGDEQVRNGRPEAFLGRTTHRLFQENTPDCEVRHGPGALEHWTGTGFCDDPRAGGEINVDILLYVNTVIDCFYNKKLFNRCTFYCFVFVYLMLARLMHFPQSDAAPPLGGTIPPPMSHLSAVA